MKVAVIGADGQLGTDLCEQFGKTGNEIVRLTIDDIRIDRIDSVDMVLRSIKPEVILNAAAFHNVPKCEEEVAMAFAVNAGGALNVARVAEDLHAVNVYFSTDYVFDGKKLKPYVENDLPNPLNVYSTSKLAGEYLTLNYASRSQVIRISGIYGKVPSIMKGSNFVSMMVKLAAEKPEVKVVTDEVLTPTPTSEIAEKCVALAQSGATGVFHLSSEGECSWFEFAQVIWETLQLKTPLLPTSVKEFASPVKRPFYSVMENERYNALPGMQKMSHWESALMKFLKEQYL
ncbi:MAG: dTDP-4-dehydrorhamnose reductase [Ignavibacteriales bacterium]|nr:dTDP-4-dehydrorhamnose reductase [Ignavibacteriales bacterium]